LITALGTIAAFTITIVAILALRPIAVVVDLVDRPGGRKTHRGKVPVIGGLAMFLGTVFGMGLARISVPLGGSLLAAFALVVTVGLLDDRFNLSPWLRLPVQAAAAALMTVGTGTEVSSIGDAFGTGTVEFHGAMMHGFTVLLVVTAINAFNMLDGMDGLAGTVAVIAMTLLGLSAAVAGIHDVAQICAVCVATVSAFLIFNLPTHLNRRVRCFMGDAGSTFLGLALAWTCIRASRSNGPGPGISDVTALWIVALPVFEFFWTFIRRVSRGQSPLRADAEHFHHLLLDAGFGVRGAFMIFLILTLLLALVGLTLNALKIPDYLSLALLVGTGATVVWSMYHAHAVLRFFPESARRRRSWPRGGVGIPSVDGSSVTTSGD